MRCCNGAENHVCVRVCVSMFVCTLIVRHLQQSCLLDWIDVDRGSVAFGVLKQREKWAATDQQ